MGIQLETNNRCCSDIGFIAQQGTNNSTVFMWNEVEEAARYILEVYRYKESFNKSLDKYSALKINSSIDFQAKSSGRFSGDFIETAKPILSVEIERTRFMCSIPDLPKGILIAQLKVEKRDGEIKFCSLPLAFYTKQAEPIQCTGCQSFVS